MALIEEMIDVYQSLPARGGRQQRKAKTRQEWVKILQKESKGCFTGNCVLIPRGIRSLGRVYLSQQPVFVSTNFVVCTLPTPEQALLLATWMATVFYQLICEVSSKDQEGMRKMEMPDIARTFVPDLDRVSEETVQRLLTEAGHIGFVCLNRPVSREVDRIWARELFGSAAEEVLANAVGLLDFQANRRNPQ